MRPVFASIGFCWGVSTSYRYATAQPALDAAVVYYGTSPSKDELAKITGAVLGHYGGDDARVNPTIEPAGGASFTGYRPGCPLATAACWRGS